MTSLTIPESVTSIGEWAFFDCRSLTSVTIPESVTSIGNDAFSCCIKLPFVTIPESVTSIGEWAFFGCIGLTSVTIPNSVTLIKNKTFAGCSGLTSVIIPESVTLIESYAFYECSGLTSVSIPNSVTKIGYGVFDKCYNIKIVVSLIDKVFDISSDVFTQTTYINSTLYVPQGTADTYRETSGWKEFANIVDGIPSAIELPDNTEETTETERYTLDGRRIFAPQRGINVVKMSDGTVKKVLVK